MFGKRRLATAAFTLMEVLVSLAIVVPVVVIGSQMFVQGLDVWEILSCRSDLQNTGQRVLIRLEEDLRSATRTAAASPPNAVVSALPDNTRISYYQPQDIDGNGTIVNAAGATEWGNAIITVRHNAGTNSLERVQSGNLRVLAINVADVRFFDITMDATLGIREVRIQLRLEKRTSTRRRLISETVASRVMLRN